MDLGSGEIQSVLHTNKPIYQLIKNSKTPQLKKSTNNMKSLCLTHAATHYPRHSEDTLRTITIYKNKNKSQSHSECHTHLHN